MFENFAKFLSNHRNKERVVAILAISVGIFLLNQVGLYGEESWTKGSEPKEKEPKEKEPKEKEPKEKEPKEKETKEKEKQK
jgi:hypothetical protein